MQENTKESKEPVAKKKKKRQTKCFPIGPNVMYIFSEASICALGASTIGSVDDRTSAVH
jgi:hypothetical protein